jgi:hypothetical protein
MTYSVLLVADVLVAIFTAISAIDSAFNGNTGWTVFWTVISGACFFFAYWLVKD